MPPGNTDSLTPEVKLNVVAHLLRENGFPAGHQRVEADADAFDGLQITRKDGETGAPNFALVEVVGCLASDQKAGWTLTKASEPIVTRDNTPSAAALKTAEATPLGRQTFGLVSVDATTRAGAAQRTQGRSARSALPRRSVRRSEPHLAQAGLGGLHEIAAQYGKHRWRPMRVRRSSLPTT